MGTKAVTARLDRLLKPLGFERRRRIWNRRFDTVVEVLDVQVGGGGYRFTVNAGVLDPDVEATLWGKEPPAFVEEPSCTVRARIGVLINGLHGLDLWWNFSDDRATDDAIADEVTEKVAAYVLPFLERTHTREAMVQWLVEITAGVKHPEAIKIINLAILKHFLGETEEGCAILARLQREGRWVDRAAEVAARLGCA
jgi:hypothetical protein